VAPEARPETVGRVRRMSVVVEIVDRVGAEVVEAFGLEQLVLNRTDVVAFAGPLARREAAGRRLGAAASSPGR
jgi:hypothetical protein